MMLSTEDKQRIECQFAAFCRVVLHNAVCGYFKDWNQKYKLETSLEHLYEQKRFEPYCTDEYFVKYDTPTDFVVREQIITVDDERLAKVLICLSEKRLEIILLRYYLRFTDTKIAEMLKQPRTTVRYQKNAALRQLRERLKEIEDGI